MKKVLKGAVVVWCENKVQAEKLKQETVKDMDRNCDIQELKRRNVN